MMDKAATSMPATNARAATMTMLRAMEMVPTGKLVRLFTSRDTMSKPPVEEPLRMMMAPKTPLRTAPKMVLMRGMTGLVMSNICTGGRFSRMAKIREKYRVDRVV